MKKYDLIFRFWEMVFVGVTSDCCVMCKFNKIVDLDSIRMLEMFQRKNVFAMLGDFTSQDDQIYKFLTYYYRFVMSFCINFCLVIHCFIVIFFPFENISIIVS